MRQKLIMNPMKNHFSNFATTLSATTAKTAPLATLAKTLKLSCGFFELKKSHNISTLILCFM